MSFSVVIFSPEHETSEEKPFSTNDPESEVEGVL
jgi:hypothetical protein